MIINWLKKYHILHDWGKWSKQKVLYKENQYYTLNGQLLRSKSPIGFHQERFCKKCNKLNYKKIKIKGA